MSKITRYNGNVVPFANNAPAGEMFVFGSSTEQSNDLTTLVSANYLRGWGVVGPSDFPPLEWFNAQAFTSTQFIAYLHQMGIPEWNGEQEYHVNSTVNRNGVLYYCKNNDHVSAIPPELDPTSWRKKRSTDVSYDNTQSGLAATDVQGAIDEVEGRVGTAETDILTNQAYVGGQTIATGSAVFNNTDNSIDLTGIGVGIEVGDVIQITGAANTENNSEFTVEVITNDNYVIVNQAHAGGTTTKSLISETASVTVKLLCKYYLAPLGLGQGWVDVAADRIKETLYINDFGRAILVNINSNSGLASCSLLIDFQTVSSDYVSNSAYSMLSSIVPAKSFYQFSSSVGFAFWKELR